MRKRLFIVGFKNIEVNDLDNFFKLDKYKKNTTLSDYLGQNFKKDVAYTLRCGGKHSPIDDRHNWDGYWVDDKEYRLTVDDGLKLQGFNDYDFVPGCVKVLEDITESWDRVSLAADKAEAFG